MTAAKQLATCESRPTPSLPSAERVEVESALAIPKRGYVDASGEYQVGDGPWTPAALSAASRAEAEVMLSEAAALEASAGKERVGKWLGMLGTICATGQMTVADAKAKLGAYASLLKDTPSGCVTRETLDRAGRAFKWFPAYAEIAEFLDREARRMEMRRRRLEQLLEAKPGKAAGLPPPRRWSDVSEAERQALDERLNAIKSAGGIAHAIVGRVNPDPAA